jgi:hypothetical protein
MLNGAICKTWFCIMIAITWTTNGRSLKHGKAVWVCHLQSMAS